MKAESVGERQAGAVCKRMVECGVVPGSSSPEAFSTYVAAESQRWGKLIRSAGIKAE